jgi:4-hydroxy-tetrahydrodipicolinate reductase
MGQSLVRALREGGELTLGGALASPGSAHLGADAAIEGPPSGVMISADVGSVLTGSAVAVDFSHAEAVAGHARACAAAAVPLLVGTTGLDPATREALDLAARSIAVLIAPNTSVGVSVALRLTGLAAAALAADEFDVEIFEAHHRHKRDAPSGTALALGEAVAGARGVELEQVADYRNPRRAPRAARSIGFSVQRAGDIVGEHTVSFISQGERLEITHRASDRRIFARGALKAAAWLVGKPAGLYGMTDVLNLGKKHGQ